MNGEEIVCNNFFETLGHKSQMIRIAQRLNSLEFVEQTDNKKYPTFQELEEAD